MDGLAAGAGWALGAAAEYSYATPRSVVVFPETAAGLVPSGGASYFLARLPRGVGAWAALTGAVLEGEMVAWAGAARLWGTASAAPLALGRALLRDAGAVSRAGADDESPLVTDPVYRAALAARAAHRADGTLEVMEQKSVGEEPPSEVFDEFARLKRWYGFRALGDVASANEAIGGEEGLDELGDAFDAGRRREDYDGPDAGDAHPGSWARAPPAAAAARRARIGATSAHAAAAFAGALNAEPPPATAMRLAVIAEAFAGGAPARAPFSVAAEPTHAERAAAARARMAETHAALRANVTAPLPERWEAALSRGGGGGLRAPALAALVDAAAARVGLALPVPLAAGVGALAAAAAAAGSGDAAPAPSALPPPPLLLSMVRLSVAAAWPAGALAARDADAIISRFLRGGAGGETPGGATGRAALSRLLAAAAARPVTPPLVFGGG